MKTMNKHNQKGFTLVELMIATSVFSIVLLIATTSIVRIGRLYYKGITQSRTQEVARSISEDISKSIQLSAGNVIDGNTLPVGSKFNGYCIGDLIYAYNPNTPVSSAPGKYGVKTKQISVADPCNSTTANSAISGGKELLGSNMRVLNFEVLTKPRNQYDVNVRIAYASEEDNALLSHYKDDGSPNNPATVDTTDAKQANCKTGIPGSSFCAVSVLDTTVKKRLNLN
jgi:prepilin-type N-terminal cleavage/methylation domain-containing protein